MAKIVECIPNFSEGQNQAVIDGLVATTKSIPGVTLLDYSSDASHNRSVFTLVGDDQSIQEAAFQLVKYASENIDMTKHHGEHPRMGAPMSARSSQSKTSPQQNVLRFPNKSQNGLTLNLESQSSFTKTLPHAQNVKTWPKSVKDNSKACQKNCWKRIGHLTTEIVRFTQLLG